MSPEGKPIQVSANSLQMAGVQNSSGTYYTLKEIYFPRIVNKCNIYKAYLYYTKARWSYFIITS